MCDEAILENGGTLESAPDYYKNQKISNRALDNFAHPLECTPDCFETQKVCKKAVNTYHSTIQFVPEY